MSSFPFSPSDFVVSVAVPPAVENSVEALDARRPIMRPIPHVAILRDELTQLFSNDYEEEEEEEMEARGEHTLSETFGGCFLAAVLLLGSLQFESWVLGLCLVDARAATGCNVGVAGGSLGEDISPSCLVTVCLENTFGHDCSLTCEDCQNGGTCNVEGTGCECPAGWSGLLCNQSEWCCA